MRVRLDRYESANRGMATRTAILFVVGGIAAVVALFGLFLGFALFFMPNEAEGDGLYARRGGIFLGVFFGAVPAAASILTIAYAVRERGRFRQLGELAAVARQSGGGVTPNDVARGLGTTPQLASRLIVDATKLGLIEHDPSPATTAPPVSPVIVAGPHAAPYSPTVAVDGSTDVVGPGSILGDTYKIESPLGRGGMGEVFTARHLRTGRRYAVKTILRSKDSDEASFRRFEREATSASALGHPGIVQVHDFNVTRGGTFYLVMDYLEGETLDERLSRGPLPWPDAQRIALELCGALGAAHEHGLIHRDIKPSNIILARSQGAAERAVLVDFGLVKPLEPTGSLLTNTGAVIGTPRYMSPEQARGEPLDVRSDLFSLAAVVFEAVTGAPPFLDHTLAGVYARLLQGTAPVASKVSQQRVPSGLDDVLARALARDRAQRFPDARSFADALARVVDDAPATERMR